MAPADSSVGAIKISAHAGKSAITMTDESENRHLQVWVFAVSEDY
jgi:hypothetical protein